ncbi:hypothetical protein H2200_010206 [Cladophialophora chaetospira]|uniref:Uncharacterized protein n=1 Tax=Cladophialophora chaetospira TaxID=386627 RepID=A0AA38X2D1_9EURO|nr:hypothetical protein H2200_010206 [Cladophialophora chaetospira]
MAEVSSSEFTVKQGDVVKKEDPIGKFHYGGSAHCMVFRPKTELAAGNLVNSPPYDPNAPKDIAFRSVLAILPQPRVGTRVNRNINFPSLEMVRGLDSALDSYALLHGMDVEKQLSVPKARTPSEGSSSESLPPNVMPSSYLKYSGALRQT